MAGALVLVEPGDELSLQALAFARAWGEPVALVIGADPGPLAVGEVHVAEHEAFDGGFAPDAWAASVLELAGRLAPSAIVAAGSDRGNDVMARVAARAGLPLAVNVTAVALDDDGARVTRLRWGGSLLEEALLEGSPALITVAPHAVAAADATGTPVVEHFTPTLAPSDLVVRAGERLGAAGGGVSLTDARVVVSGGRGVGSAEGFAPIEELAELLGAAVGCSRAVTMAGWRPHSDQVGQTGSKIAPEIYIACGISGATQHMAGCKGAKRLLAINPDVEAPMLGAADYAVIGDLHEVVPAISEAIRRARAAR